MGYIEGRQRRRECSAKHMHERRVLTRDRGYDQRGPCLFVAGVEDKDSGDAECAGNRSPSALPVRLLPGPGARLETFASGQGRCVTCWRVACDVPTRRGCGCC